MVRAPGAAGLRERQELRRLVDRVRLAGGCAGRDGLEPPSVIGTGASGPGTPTDEVHQLRPIASPSPRPPSDVERVVRAQVDPREPHERHDQPRHPSPASSEVGRDRPREAGHQHDVAGHERHAGRSPCPPRTIASGSVTPGRSRWTTSHTSVRATSLHTVTSEGCDREPVAAKDERDQRHERDRSPARPRNCAMHDRFERLGQAVDRLEDRALQVAHGAVAGDEPAQRPARRSPRRRRSRRATPN